MSEKTSYEKSAIYDYPTEPVPKDKRITLVNISFITAGISVAMSVLYTGAILASVLSFNDAVLAIVGGCLCLLLMAVLLGNIGAETGVTFSVLSRHSFGTFGSKIVSLILAITLTSSFAWLCVSFGQTMNMILPDTPFTKVQVAAIWGGILMMSTAAIGFKGLAVLNRIACPLILGICIWGSIKAFSQVGFDTIVAHAPAEPSTIGFGITIVIGGWIFGVIMQPDVSRYAKNKKHNKIACVIALIVFGVANLCAMVMVKAAGTETIMAAMVELEIGISSLFMIILALWINNASNLYSASLGVSNITKIPKWKISIALGALATATASTGLTDLFTPFITFLDVYLPPIGGIIIVDYYLLGKKNFYSFDKDTVYRQINIFAIIAVILGALIPSQLPWDFRTISSFIIGGVLYYFMMNEGRKAGFDPYKGDETNHV